MRQRLNTLKEPNFSFIIAASFVLHLIFIALVSFPVKTKQAEYKSYFVDLVGPIEIRKETPAVTPDAGKSKTDMVKESPVNSKPRAKTDTSLKAIESLKAKKAAKEKVTKEIDRLRAISSLSKLKDKKEMERSQGIDIIRQKVNGSSSKSQSAQSVLADSYYAMIIRKIKNVWVYPQTDVEDLEAIISFRMDRDGKVISHRIEKSSGSALFDRSAVNAVLKASPLPPHPEEDEIEVRFHL